MALELSVPKALRGLLRLGTCSWKYDSWKGLVYEKGKTYRPDDYLPDYAKRLDSVEVDQWFWSLFPGGPRLPDPDGREALREERPGRFRLHGQGPELAYPDPLLRQADAGPRRLRREAERPLPRS